MKTDGRNTKFENIILEALKTGGKQDFPPFHIFQAAIGDLAGDYRKEKTFLLKIADEKYYSLCMKAADGLRAGNTGGMSAASEYLQDKYMVDDGWSKYITRAMAQAFAEHKYGVKVTAPTEPAGKKKAPAPRPARAPKPASAPKPARAPKPASAPQPVATPQQGAKKPVMIIAIAAAVVVLAVGFLVVGRHGGPGALQSDSTGTKDGTTYTVEGITFTLPGIHNVEYSFTTWDTTDTALFSIEKRSCGEADLEECWKQDVESEESDSYSSNIQSGEMGIDGKTCYWISYLYMDSSVREILVPRREQYSVEITIWGDTDAETNEVIDKLARGIHYTENIDNDNTDSYMSGLGVSVPIEKGWELLRARYSSLNSNLTVDCILSDANSGPGLNETYRNELDSASEDSDYTVLEQGEAEIDGAKGRWFDYEKNFSEGDRPYYYSLFFKHKSKIVQMKYWFNGPGDHASVVQEINDSIHFEDE